MSERKDFDIDALIEAARKAVDDDRYLHRRIPGGGVLHIERRLPFLAVYRRPRKRRDKGTARLVTTQPAYLIIEENALPDEELTELITTIADSASEHLESFLLVEIWSAPVPAPDDGLPQAKFRIVTPERDALTQTVKTLADSLAGIRLAGFAFESTVVRTPVVQPPAVSELLMLPEDEAEPTWHHIGLEVPAVFRDEAQRQFFPRVLDRLRAPLGAALRSAVFRFCADNDIQLGDQRAISLAPKRFEKAAVECDREILEICAAFELLLLVTPVNAETAWAEFEKGGFEQAPVFFYRPLPFDPAELKRRLFSVPLERIHDPVVKHLFEEKRLELDQQISLLRDRGSPEFLYGSLQLYGGVEPELLDMAEQILRGSGRRTNGGPRDIGAHAFCSALSEELDWYRGQNAEFAPEVEVRDDIPAGLMVSEGRMYVSEALCLQRSRVNPLIQHELGTHVVTHFNGERQPFGQLASGLAHHESTQEGLAVLAEYAVGGLTAARARTLAGRVLAVHSMIAGDPFVDVFERLRACGFSPRGAWNISMRVFRGGGLTKDAIYLKGMLDVMRFIDGPESLDLLLLGKLSTAQAPLVDELLQREIVAAPAVRPRYCDDPEARERILSCGRQSLFEVLGVDS